MYTHMHTHCKPPHTQAQNLSSTSVTLALFESSKFPAFEVAHTQLVSRLTELVHSNGTTALPRLARVRSRVLEMMPAYGARKSGTQLPPSPTPRVQRIHKYSCCARLWSVARVGATCVAPSHALLLVGCENVLFS